MTINPVQAHEKWFLHYLGTNMHVLQMTPNTYEGTFLNLTVARKRPFSFYCTNFPCQTSLTQKGLGITLHLAV